MGEVGRDGWAWRAAQGQGCFLDRGTATASQQQQENTKHQERSWFFRHAEIIPADVRVQLGCSFSAKAPNRVNPQFFPTESPAPLRLSEKGCYAKLLTRAMVTYV
ncbi:MAG TPA: hypothetical protein DCY42_13830 [Chloroflexi bacterium]|nr:hypothetical protein [Chloroflexota bacterium]